MMRILGILVATLIMATFHFGGSYTNAQQVPPHIFVGTVTGEEAVDGAEVWAIIQGKIVGKTVVKEGNYVLQVSPWETKDIWFAVAHRAANEEAKWVQGGVTLLNLTIEDKRCG